MGTPETVTDRPASGQTKAPAVSNGSASPAPPQKPASQRIGPYILGKTLGVGSTGRVKLATHCETNLRVAIKIISKEMLDPNVKDPKKIEGNKKLEREITIMKLITHPNVLQLYDVYETNKELFLVLEVVEGGELFDYLVKKGRLTEPEAVGFFQQIIMGVEYCHRHLIVHRDLKPENLLLDKDKNVKVADFGMASMQVPSKMLETSCGSPHYASPEIIRGIKYDGPSADVWSCGVILYALVTGNLPFDDENIRRLLNKVKTGMFFIPDYVSPDARDLIKRMLVVDPAKRISMADIMAHPWFTSKPLKPSMKYVPSALETESMLKPIPAESELEEDIIDSLVLLGWTNRDETIHALRSEGPNAEKVFYNLLHRRKWEMFENYDAEKDSQYEMVGGPRRRTDSFSSPEKEEPSDGEPESPSKGPSRRAVSDPHRRVVAAASVRVNSPLAASVTPNSIANESKDELQQSPRPGNSAPGSPSVARAADQIPLPVVAPKSDLKTSPANLAAVQKKKNPLMSITIPVGAEGSGAPQTAPVDGNNSNIDKSGPNSAAPRSPVVNQALAAMGLGGGSLGTPKFHRKENKNMEVPATPIITQTPKQSWFTNLFNFKPESFGLISLKPMEETIQATLALLSTLEIKYQMRKDGLVKCKYDPSSFTFDKSPIGGVPDEEPMTILSPTRRESAASPADGSLPSPAATGKVVKFKIEFFADSIPQNNGESKVDVVRVQLTQQQGAFSTFTTVFERLQAKWILEH